MHAVCILTTALLFVNVCRLFLSTLILVKFENPILKDISFILHFKILAVTLLVILARN
jgi:uncharacterized membrane protein